MAALTDSSSPTITKTLPTSLTTFPEFPTRDSRTHRLLDTAPATTTASQQQTWLPPPTATGHPPQPTFTADFNLFPATTPTRASQASPHRAPSLDSTLQPSFNSPEAGALPAQDQFNNPAQTNYTTQRISNRPARPPVPLFHSNSTGSFSTQPDAQFQQDIMGGGVNVAYEGTFGDLSSAGDTNLFNVDGDYTFDSFISNTSATDSMPSVDFTAINSGMTTGVTVSPKDVFNSVPPSTSFTNLTTPGSAYLETPDDDYETSPLFSDNLEADNGGNWSSLFPEYETTAATAAPMMVRNPSGSQIVVHAGGDSLTRKRGSTAASPATFSPAAIKHSAVAGVAARKRDKPLPPIIVDEHDTVALKRARNTAAARKSRAKKVEERDDLMAEIAELRAQVDYWKALAETNGGVRASLEE